MEHTMKIRIGRPSSDNGVLSCQPVTIRERVLRLLFGQPHRMMILVPGDAIKEIEIDNDPGKHEHGGASNG